MFGHALGVIEDPATGAAAAALAGYLGDRFSRSALVTWSIVAWSVVTILTAFIQTTEEAPAPWIRTIGARLLSPSSRTRTRLSPMVRRRMGS